VDVPQFSYDAFISYSRKDAGFARRLHQALRSYRPPRDLPVPQRGLRVFRDETDFVGTEYHASLDRNLQDAATLIVICSPNSAGSEYVADEIARFTAHRDKERVIAILLDGIPNNEAKPEESARRAFPEKLVSLLPVPLAADYRGFDPRRDRVEKGRFAQAWFKTLADVYAPYGIDRGRIEQREHKRRAERLRNLAAASSAIAVALVGLTIWALVSRHEARVQRDLATAGQREAEARLAFDNSGDGLVRATLLSAASLRSAQTVEGLVAMTRFLRLLPRQPEWRQPPTPQRANAGSELRPALAMSIDGSQIAATEQGNEILWFDANSGTQTRRLTTACRPSSRPALAFSPSGALLAVGCTRQICLLDTSSGAPCRWLPDDGSPHGDMVWSASFSPDSRLLASASYHSDDVMVHDIEAGQSAIAIGTRSSNIRATAISPNGEWLVATSNQRVRLWRVGQYQAPATEVRTADDFTSIAFEPDSDAFVTAGAELVRWSILAQDEQPVQLQQQARLAIKARTVLPVVWRNRTCLVAAASSAVHLLCGERLTEVLRIPTSSVAAAVSRDGQRLVNEEADGTLVAWPTDGGLDVMRIAVETPVRSIALALDQSWIAAGGDDGSVTLFDPSTWKAQQRLHVPEGVKRITRSADGRLLVVSTNNSLHVFDTATWQELKAYNYRGTLATVAFTPGQRLLIAVGDNSVVGFSTSDWHRMFELAHDGSIDRVAIDANASRVATSVQYAGGHDSGVRLDRVADLASDKQLAWKYSADGGSSVSQQRMLGLIAEHHTRATGGDLSLLALSQSWASVPVRMPDAPAATTPAWTAAASGNVITVSHSPSARVIGEWDQQGDVTDLLFLPENEPRWLLSAGSDGLLRLWPLTADDLIPEACARLKRILTPQAWTQLANDASDAGTQAAQKQRTSATPRSAPEQMCLGAKS
jgi:WD40 repeat protein